MASYDIIGNIAIIKPEINGKKKTKKELVNEANVIIKDHKSVKTVVSKSDRIKGRLRTIKPKHVLGEKNLVARYVENGCEFVLDVSTCYFSSRLSNDRKRLASKIKKTNKVLCMFAGVGVYPIVIKKLANPKEIVAVELGRDCCKYFKKNLILNKISENRIKIIQGDVKKKVTKDLGIFNVVVMTRPNLRDTFLEPALSVCRKGTKIFYHLFCHEDDLDSELVKLVDVSRNIGRRVKVKNVERAGDIAPYKHRYMVEIKVLS
ncbi:hypothetical protein GOV14_05900 [Candidatus Pacearchaeota archaeon]|nr:hypothetical protein [Candidatus Pacearchaeota archaeon]